VDAWVRRGGAKRLRRSSRPDRNSPRLTYDIGGARFHDPSVPVHLRFPRLRRQRRYRAHPNPFGCTRRCMPALEGPPSMRLRTRPVRRSVAAAGRVRCPRWPRRGNSVAWSDGRNGSGRSQNVVASVSLESEQHKRPSTGVVGSASLATLRTVVGTGSHATVLCRVDIRMFAPAARCEKVGMTAGTCPMLTV
jgi:hypothetical protein